jgi:hypothetical protein
MVEGVGRTEVIQRGGDVINLPEKWREILVQEQAKLVARRVRLRHDLLRLGGRD